ncbi:hypothetical protein E2C01_096160 [Portunus trituberculatus]|uniref:Uncharacterized protein n=1 Tax=Portunus trituberculatus TaxID=210409 RepID=A0A5B7JRY7_PORTR|nr:hypothetical protein [Portunus trituberculatus]
MLLDCYNPSEFGVAFPVLQPSSQKPVEGSKENIAPPEKKMVAKTQPPVPTMTYTVSTDATHIDTSSHVYV